MGLLDTLLAGLAQPGQTPVAPGPGPAPQGLSPQLAQMFSDAQAPQVPPMGMAVPNLQPPQPQAPPPQLQKLPPPETEPTAPPKPTRSVIKSDASPDFESGYSTAGTILHGLFGNGVIGGLGEAMSQNAAHDAGVAGANSTYQALVGKGVDPKLAEAAVRNPSILQQIAPGVFGPKAPIKIGPDERIIGPDASGNMSDITPASVGARAKLGPGQVYAPDGSIQYQPGYLDSVRQLSEAQGKDISPEGRKAILDADTKVRSGNQVKDLLKEALDYSKTASSGFMGAHAGSIVNTFGDWAPQSSQDADYLNNLVINSILPQLKSTFGGRVTNVDVNLMKDLQGVASKPTAEREKIINRAIAAVDKANGDLQSEAEALRGHTYFKPGGGDGAQGNAQGNGSTDQPAATPQSTTSPAAGKQASADEPQVPDGLPSYGDIVAQSKATGASASPQQKSMMKTKLLKSYGTKLGIQIAKEAGL